MRMNKMNKLMKALVAKEVMEHAAKDASKFMRKAWKNWDPDMSLRRVGLTTYKPARATMGSASLFLFGAAVGGLAALILAPKPGTELRKEVLSKWNERVNGNPMPANSMRLESAPNARV